MGCYDPPGPCADGPPPGSLALVGWWTRNYGLPNYGICNCRDVRGGKTPSMHGPCRAGDLAANWYYPEQREKMEHAIAFLIRNATELGVQYIIWAKRSWKCERGWAPYNGVSPHTDHAHVELTERGANHASPLWLGNHNEEEGFMAGLSQKQQEETYHNVGLLPNVNHQQGMTQAIIREEARLTRIAIAEMEGHTVELDDEDRKALARDVIAGITNTEEWRDLVEGLSDQELQAIAEGVNDALHRRLAG
jgi:hypothetical protein